MSSRRNRRGTAVVINILLLLLLPETVAFNQRRHTNHIYCTEHARWLFCTLSETRGEFYAKYVLRNYTVQNDRAYETDSFSSTIINYRILYHVTRKFQLNDYFDITLSTFFELVPHSSNAIVIIDYYFHRLSSIA